MPAAGMQDLRSINSGVDSCVVIGESANETTVGELALNNVTTTRIYPSAAASLQKLE
jgi:hypothetical protein